MRVSSIMKKPHRITNSTSIALAFTALFVATTIISTFGGFMQRKASAYDWTSIQSDTVNYSYYAAFTACLATYKPLSTIKAADYNNNGVVSPNGWKATVT